MPADIRHLRTRIACKHVLSRTFCHVDEIVIQPYSRIYTDWSCFEKDSKNTIDDAIQTPGEMDAKEYRNRPIQAGPCQDTAKGSNGDGNGRSSTGPCRFSR